MLINQDTQPTVIELQAALRKDATAKMTNEFNNVQFVLTDLFNLIWNNKNLTPQQALDAFGTDAASLFTVSLTFQNALNSVVPNSINLVPPNTITLNPDGTVTVGDPATV